MHLLSLGCSRSIYSTIPTATWLQTRQTGSPRYPGGYHSYYVYIFSLDPVKSRTPTSLLFRLFSLPPSSPMSKSAVSPLSHSVCQLCHSSPQSSLAMPFPSGLIRCRTKYIFLKNDIHFVVRASSSFWALSPHSTAHCVACIGSSQCIPLSIHQTSLLAVTIVLHSQRPSFFVWLSQSHCHFPIRLESRNHDLFDS